MGPTYAGNKLNDTNKQVLSFIERFLGQHRYAPSLDEIVEGTTAKSKGHVSPCLDRLENMGYIQRDKGVARSIRLVRSLPDVMADKAKTVEEIAERVLSIPIVGPIAAGKPIHIPESRFSAYDPETTVDVPLDLLPPRANIQEIFALQVKGHSMIDAMVADGDIVVLTKPDNLENGDIVAAWLKEDESTTLKKFFRNEDGVRLQPANPDPQYKPIMLKDPDSIDVQGIVVAVIRKTW